MQQDVIEPLEQSVLDCILDESAYSSKVACFTDAGQRFCLIVSSSSSSAISLQHPYHYHQLISPKRIGRTPPLHHLSHSNTISPPPFHNQLTTSFHPNPQPKPIPFTFFPFKPQPPPSLSNPNPIQALTNPSEHLNLPSIPIQQHQSILSIIQTHQPTHQNLCRPSPSSQTLIKPISPLNPSLTKPISLRNHKPTSIPTHAATTKLTYQPFLIY